MTLRRLYGRINRFDYGEELMKLLFFNVRNMSHHCDVITCYFYGGFQKLRKNEF